MTEVVSSARTVSVASLTGPNRLNVSEKVTAVPFGTLYEPGIEVSPVSAKETQLEPGRGSAQNAFPTMFCVGPALGMPRTIELLVVLAAELAIKVTVSAFAVIRVPPRNSQRAKLLILIFLPFCNSLNGKRMLSALASVNPRCFTVKNETFDHSMGTIRPSNPEELKYR